MRPQRVARETSLVHDVPGERVKFNRDRAAAVHPCSHSPLHDGIHVNQRGLVHFTRLALTDTIKLKHAIAESLKPTSIKAQQGTPTSIFEKVHNESEERAGLPRLQFQEWVVPVPERHGQFTPNDLSLLLATILFPPFHIHVVQSSVNFCKIVFRESTKKKRHPPKPT